MPGHPHRIESPPWINRPWKRAARGALLALLVLPASCVSRAPSRPIAARFEGTANFHDPGKVADWEKYFMAVWERSQPDEEFRRLYL